MSLEEEIRHAVREEVTAALERTLPTALRQALLAQQTEAEELDSIGAARLLGKLHADGSPNPAALKSFMQRHPVPYRKVGRRLVFSRTELLQWLNAHPQVQRRIERASERTEAPA